jgi:hypothetical protein
MYPYGFVCSWVPATMWALHSFRAPGFRNPD